MKKLLLLLVFVVNAALAFAMSGPVQETNLQNPVVGNEITISDAWSACVVCAQCDGLTICAFASNCGKAGTMLSALLEQWGCDEVD